MKILIMAGGSGERFWPLSTRERPKQLLSLVSSKSMIRETVDRVLKYVEPKDIYIATNEIQSTYLRREVSDIPQRNIIIEPAFKDTAAAIAYGSMIISRDINMDDVISVLPSDHLIALENEFIQCLQEAEELAKKGYIVTFGIKPNRPETGYGYILLDNVLMNKPSKVIKFKEKPNRELAIEYLNQGNYVWNSGMFVFKYSTILTEFKTYMPAYIDVINEMKVLIDNKVGIELSNATKFLFDKFERVSIDVAVMEKSEILQCMMVDLGWNDIGGFNSLADVFIKDVDNNVVKNANYVQIDSSNNIVISDKQSRMITSIGVSNMIIVDAEEAILVCNREEPQKLKELLKKIAIKDR